MTSKAYCQLAAAAEAFARAQGVTRIECVLSPIGDEAAMRAAIDVAEQKRLRDLVALDFYAGEEH